MSAAKKWVVPPGYRVLDDVVREYGRDHAQTKLISGQWPAFQLDLDTGDLRPIPVTTWGVARGRNWLEKGASGLIGPPPPDHAALRLRPRLLVYHYAVIVRISEQPHKQQKRKAPQGDRVDEAMAKCFPDGTDGILTKAVHKAVVEALKPDSKKRGLPDPSETTVKRRLGRRK
jgi:hypothetical protein